MKFFFIIEETGAKQDLVFLSFDKKAALRQLNEIKKAKLNEFGPHNFVERPRLCFAVTCRINNGIQETEYRLRAIDLDLTKTFAELGTMKLEFSFKDSLLDFLLTNFGVAVIEDDHKKKKPNMVSADKAISQAVNSPGWVRRFGINK